MIMNSFEQKYPSRFGLINTFVLVNSDILLERERERERERDEQAYIIDVPRTRNIIKNQTVSNSANFISSLNNKKINAEILKRYCGILWAFQHF